MNVVVETLKRATKRDNALEELCRSFPSAGAFARFLVDEGQKTESGSLLFEQDEGEKHSPAARRAQGT